MNFNQTIKSLVFEIKNTREFNELKQGKAGLDKYSDVKQKIEILQKRQMELFSSNKSTKEIENEVKEINRQFESLSRIPEVRRMVRAGENFNKMMSKIYQDINLMLDSELEG